MKKIILFYSIFFVSFITFGQCTINDIIPFKTGKTKFQNQSIENLNGVIRNEQMYHGPYLSPDEYVQNMNYEGRQIYEKFSEEMKKTYLANIQSSYDLHKNDKYPEHEMWLKPDYLKKDSIYKISRYLKWEKVPCLNGNEPNVLLQYADDTLYRILITLNYTKNEFNKMYEDYKTLIGLFKPYYLSETFTTKDQIN